MTHATPPDLIPSSATFNLKPLLIANMASTMAMMAFVAIIGPIARQLHLPAWQAGTAITVGGVLWMLLSRPWGVASDRRGRRAVLLTGVGGFALSYWAMCAVLVLSLQTMPAATWVFVGLLVTRGAIGAFYAAIPATGQALVADFIAADRRAGAMASLGAANAVGVVIGPAMAAMLAQHSLSLPLYVTAILPAIAWLVLWKALPRQEHPVQSQPSTLHLHDVRLRRPMAVAFIAMFCVAIAQITVGFFAIDRLQLAPELAARAAGFALTAVGIGLIASQLLVRQLSWPPMRLIRTGAVVAAAGFGATATVDTAALLAACYFVAAAGMGWIFPAFAALAANAVGGHEQGTAAGSVGAAQGLGIVLGPLVGTLLYGFGPGVPYLLVALMLMGVALWPSIASNKPVTAV
ncbi:MFS transporter [Rhodoferax sp. U11-2br]|uniref:MFS transporter n=1 Tax=Rhodoferax sp. U11-2br TaxID=2838878 RepID=UPI001BEC134D|nr:MFS transporter [Rhodoferax sp. U11-2br]MBT3069185.1 MFS transporter [Rhodoferax sp. U11-2br]